MDESKKTDLVNKSWKIEEYPQGNKYYVMWKRFKQEKRSQQNTYNVLTESFSKFVLQKIWNKIYWAEGNTKIHRIEKWYI